MKPLKTLKAKKLTINKETLRTLTESDLQRVDGAYINTTGSQWCSSTADRKCGGIGGGGSLNCYNP